MSIARCDQVSVAPFRERFLQMEAGERENMHYCGDGLQPKDAGTVVAERLGWRDNRNRLDGHRVRRVLGLRPCPGRNGETRLRERVSLETAYRLCEALDIDPVDVGL